MAHTLTQRRTAGLAARLALSSALTLAALLAPVSASAETGTVVSNDVALHVSDEGSGEAIVMLHGFAGSSDMWPAIGLAPLEGFRIISFDARGHGRSGKPETADAYGRQLVEDVLAVMEARQVEVAHIVGYSMGAETALSFAVAHPDKVASLVVAGSGWSGEQEAGTYGFASDALSGIDSFGGFMAAMTPPDLDLPPEAEAAMGAMLAAHGIDPAQSAAPLAAVSASLPEIISIPASELATIAVPVLGLAGSEDPEHDAVAKLAGVLPDFTFVSIEGADHLAAPLDPAFAAAVTAFLAD